MTINKTKLKKIIKEEMQKYLKEYDDYAYDIANDSDWQESQRYEEEETKKVWNTLSRAVQRKVKKNANDWKKRDELYMKLTAALDKIDDAQDNSYYADMIIEMAREGKFTSDVSDLDDESPVAATKKAHRMSQQRRYARKTAPVPPRLGMVESKTSLEKIKEVLNESDFVQTRPDIRSQQDQDRHDAMLDKQAARWKDELAASDKEREVKRRRRPHKYRLVVGDKDEGTYATKQETIDQLQRIWMELDGPYPAYSIIPIDPPIRR